jgi:hypothetical protein
MTTVTLAFRALRRAPQLDDSYSQIPVSDDNLHTDPEYSVDACFCRFEDGEDIERGWCARISMTSPTPGPYVAHTPSPRPTIPGLEIIEKRQTTICYRSRRLTRKALQFILHCLESEFLSVYQT